MNNKTDVTSKQPRPLKPHEIERKDALIAQIAAHGLSVKDVAFLIHVAPSCVYNWRNGWTPMPDRAWLQLQEKLNPEPAHVDMRTVAGSGRVLRLGDTWGVR